MALHHSTYTAMLLYVTYPSRLLEPSFSCTRELVSRRAESMHTHTHTHAHTTHTNEREIQYINDGSYCIVCDECR